MLRHFLAASALSLCIVTGAFAQDSLANKVAALHAYRFHVERAEFDNIDLLAPGADSIDLLNVDSPALLVLVTLDGARNFDSTGTIRLTVTVDNKPLTQHVVRLRQFLYNERGRIAVPFIIYGMLCGSYAIRAALVRGDRIVAERSGSIDFQCGD